MTRVLEVFGEPIISGGQEAFVNNIVENIDYTDLSIDLFTPYYCNNENYKSNVEKHEGKVYSAGLDFMPGKSRFNIIKVLDIHFQSHKYDVVHIHSGSVSVLALTSRVAYKHNIKKIIVHSHSPAERETIKHLLIKLFFFKSLYKYPTKYVACSMNAALCKFPNVIARKKTIFINNGINLEKFRFNIAIRNIIRSQLDIKESDFVIGHIGRFSSEKNHVFLLKIFRDIVAENRDAKLLLIGDGELRKEIEQKSVSMKINQNIIFTGSVNNVNEYLQAMDVFVLPSLYEGLPFVGVESQAAGLPVIVSTGVSKELNLTNSIWYEELDVKKWVDRIKSLINFKRVDNLDKLRDQGFDISETASILRKMYVE